MPIACVHVPHFSLRVALLGRPELDGAPLVLTSSPTARALVEDCTPEAATRGVRLGMPLREVTALCPDAVFIPPNPVRDSAVATEIVRALESFSPLVEPGSEGTREGGRWYVDLLGLERHYDTIEEAAHTLLRLVPPVLRPRVGVAPGKFTAWVAARQAPPGSSRQVTTADAPAFLAKVSVAWLPVSPDLPRRFERLGLRTLGDLATLPAPALQARFGPAGRLAWDLATGHDETWVAPPEREETIVEGLTLPAPATSRETLLIGLRQLIGRAFTRPELRDHHVRQARLRVLIEENRSWEKVMIFREPLGRQRLVEVLGHRLQAVELPGAAEALTLELAGLVAETVHQDRLPGFRSRQLRPIVEATRQLKQRYGASPIYRITEVEPWSRIPERRHALISYDP
ncbi:MAG: DNA polymerase Y family protein [Thermomicrobiales bacterium]